MLIMSNNLWLLFLLLSIISIQSDAPNIKQNDIDCSSAIFYSKKRNNSEGWSIYSKNPKELTETLVIPFSGGMGEYNPAISPDGNTVIFNTYRYGGWKLATYHLTKKTTTRITKVSNYFTNASYSPSGQQIVYEKNIGRSTHICIANSNGQNETILTYNNESTENRIPVWTPDGKSIVYYSERGGTNDIFIVDIESGIKKNLTDNKDGNDFAPSISPNGKQIAFFSDRNGHLDLYTMDLFSERQTLLTKNLQNENNTYNYFTDTNTYWIFKNAWSPDGNDIVFSNATGDNIDLFVIAKNGTDIRNITNSPESEYTPSWGCISPN